MLFTVDYPLSLLDRTMLCCDLRQGETALKSPEGTIKELLGH